MIGRPSKVTTVDRYQGLQNDYILLSLVRTRAVGHLRDVRRLVVAMSRARLGLYVFGRVSLFKDCFELQPVFNILLKRPTKLHLLPEEIFPGTRKLSDDNKNESESKIIENMSEMADFAYKLYLSRINDMKENMESLKKLYEPPPTEKTTEEDENENDQENKTEPMETDTFVETPIQNEVDVVEEKD